MSDHFRVVRSNICTEFDDQTIGTKVTDVYAFSWGLRAAVDDHEFPDNGQAVIELDDYLYKSVNTVVSAGVGEPTTNPDDYVLRRYRGRVGKYLKRRHAVEAENCRAVVYTKAAYLEDPDTDETERTRIKCLDCEYVLVSVLADGAEEQDSPLTPRRLAENLAGGNNEVEDWTKDDIIEKAEEAVEYYDDFHVVAD